MVKSDYVCGYEEGVSVMVDAVDQAIKRNKGAKTVQDCVAALNDIIVKTHEVRLVIGQPAAQEEDEMIELVASLFPGAKIIKLNGGAGK